MLGIYARIAALTSRSLNITKVKWSKAGRAVFSSSADQQGPTDADESETAVWNADERKMEPAIPEYSERQGETEEVLRARLQYQSRKRGTLENGLLLSSFCSRYLPSMNANQLVMYDRLINKPTNDWDIYYWVTGNKAVPAEFDNEVMTLLKDFAKNSDKELRVIMPDVHRP